VALHPDLEVGDRLEVRRLEFVRPALELLVEPPFRLADASVDGAGEAGLLVGDGLLEPVGDFAGPAVYEDRGPVSPRPRRAVFGSFP
jgi:hypothetical protein